MIRAMPERKRFFFVDPFLKYVQICCLWFFLQLHHVLKVSDGEDFSSTEELNPDCYVLVYAVDDDQSFGKF